MADPYAILGVASDAPLSEVEASYARARGQALAAGGDERATEARLAELDRAWSQLKDRPSVGGAAPATAKGAHDHRLAPLQPHALAQQPLMGQTDRVCPYCGGHNPVQVTTCGECGQQIMRECPACGFAVGLVDRVCGRCGTAILEHDQRRFAEALSVQRRVQEERTTSDTRVRELEATHLARAWQGVLFWLVVAALVVGAVTGLVTMLSRGGG
jgi:hypothetical protein